MVFVSDTHFKRRYAPDEKDRRERFLSFLGRLHAGSVLVLLGDIFDFYFEHRSTIPKHYFDIFYALCGCVQRGVRVHFLGGNHDYWTKNFLQDGLGIIVHKKRILFACQGRKILCVHGDLAMSGDVGYKILRTVIQSRPVIAAAGLLHPDLLEAIAAFVSQKSKSQQSGSHETIAHALGAAAGGRFFEQQNDVFVMGHIHHPHHVQPDGRDFVILGGWLEHFTYGRLSEGKIAVESFTG
ncbi:MAG: UDP-2,3-diacylglucosamine diphosphatase [Candidatus Latescibacterota bacterium]